MQSNILLTRRALAAISLGLFASLGGVLPAEAQAPLPAGWPSRVELGMADAPGGAAAMKQTAPFAFRYQYLAGGVNTGGGWATWNTNGDFPKFYIQDSVANGVIPVFTYYMTTATLGDGKDPTTLDDVKRAADEYNKIAAAAKKEGIQQGLHNEGFEMTSVGGRRTYDILLELLDPSLVKFQFQMSTISRGFVAADYFTKYPGRFYSMHVQDVDLKSKKAQGPDDDGRGVQVPVGQGSIDWTKTFKAAKDAGVTSYYVEQTMAFTKESVEYLKKLKV